MVAGQMLARDATNVVAGDFWADMEPGYDCVADFVCSIRCITNMASYAEASRFDTVMKFGAVKRLSCACAM